MRFLGTFIGAILCASCVGAAVASEPLSVAGTKHASVRVLECDREGQEALFRAAMRRYPGTRRMWLRFTLLQREPGERYQRVRARGLNRWKRSRSGVQRFAHRQRVRGLSDGHEYRVRVDYRWLDADGDVIRRRGVRSRTCSLVRLPNLRVTGIERAPQGTGERYTIGVENLGELDSAPTGIRVVVDGQSESFGPIPALAPRESTTVGVNGPACAYRVRALVDPAQLVRESREYDNALARDCF